MPGDENTAAVASAGQRAAWIATTGRSSRAEFRKPPAIHGRETARGVAQRIRAAHAVQVPSMPQPTTVREARGMAPWTRAESRGPGVEHAAAVTVEGRRAAWLATPVGRPAGWMPSASRSSPAWRWLAAWLVAPGRHPSRSNHEEARGARRAARLATSGRPPAGRMPSCRHQRGTARGVVRSSPAAPRGPAAERTAAAMCGSGNPRHGMVRGVASRTWAVIRWPDSESATAVPGRRPSGLGPSASWQSSASDRARRGSQHLGSALPVECRACRGHPDVERRAALVTEHERHIADPCAELATAAPCVGRPAP